VKTSWASRLALSALVGLVLSCVNASESVTRANWPAPPWGDSLPRALFDAREPILNAREPQSKTRATIRLVWVRTFHAPAVVRAERDGHDARLVTTLWSGAGGYEWKAVARRDSIALDPSTFARLSRVLDEAEFWTRDTAQVRGLDGSTWLIEYRVGNEYHVRSIWTPGAEGRGAAVHALGLELIRSAGLGSEEIY
jgi:hypothetical protein